MSSGNGHGGIPVEIVESQFAPIADFGPPPRPRRRPVLLPLLLLLLTILSTLAVGAEFGRAYAQSEEPFSTSDNPFATMVQPFLHPHMLLLGIPFSFTLLTILMAHELGHYFACRIHGIDVSYPYFIPAPTIFGTFGAFIQIRSRIPTRSALFDVGLSGPVVGFIFAIPALIFAVANSKIDAAATTDPNALHFGIPPILFAMISLFHPHIRPEYLLLHPVGRAAWVGLFVTSLNLLPAWQLDGGHILYSITSEYHRRISLAVGAIALAMGRFCWPGWYLWGGLIVVFSIFFRHPPLLNRWESLDSTRRVWAFIAIAIFLLSFTPWPTTTP